MTMANGQLSENFKLWCRKLDHLSDNDFKRGFDEIEWLVKDAARTGDKIWPPSYAKFIGSCEQMPGYAAHKSFPPILPEPEEYKSRRRKVGEKAISDMLKMFD